MKGSPILPWVLGGLAFWALATWLLWRAWPVSLDGAGPVATLYWGPSAGSPTLAEYTQDWRVRRSFVIPYAGLAALYTLLCLLWARKSRSTAVWTVASAFALLLGLSLVIGAGGRAGLWPFGLLPQDLWGWAFLLRGVIALALLTGVVRLVLRLPRATQPTRSNSVEP